MPKMTKTQELAAKNKKRREQGKQTTSKDLPPGKLRKTGKAIENRRKRMESIWNNS